MSQSFIQEAVTNGASGSTSLMDAIGKAAARIEEIASQMSDAKETDTARWTALNEERVSQAATLSQLQEQFQKARINEEHERAIADVADLKAKLASMRAPSKAGLIGGGRVRSGYEPGSFIGALLDLSPSSDPDVRMAAKARLAEMSSRETAFGKATLGTSDATGGWIIPNALVDELIRPPMVDNVYSGPNGLMTVISGVTTAAVDLPYRDAARSAAVIADFGTEKQNVNLVYNGYTATIYTMARIYDIGNQFLRQSRGAAEADVLAELGASFAQGESYYIREGTGSSQPYGYIPALTNGPAAYRSAFTPSSTTLAGSIAAAIAKAAGALAGRGARPTAAVMSAAAYWTMLAQGTDSAGFFFAPSTGPSDIRPGTLVTAFGLPIYADAAADLQGTATVTDDLVVANFKAFKVFHGQNFRIDSNDSAGTRWDYNVTGFRGELEVGFDARPVVYSGHAQLITDVTP